MLTLYYKPTCPYSQHVLGEAEAMNISFNLKDVTTDMTLLTELMEKGGKNQVPFLLDEDRGESLYESNDIIAYLEKHYATGEKKESFGGLRIHRSDEACDTCQ